MASTSKPANTWLVQSSQIKRATGHQIISLRKRKPQHGAKMSEAAHLQDEANELVDFLDALEANIASEADYQLLGDLQQTVDAAYKRYHQLVEDAEA